jgi:RimJ/RimL family protein N-acetyltransferase
MQPIQLELADGGMLEVRPLEARDRAGLADAIARLSDDSRYFRFGAAKPRMTERELDHLVDVDHHDREALVAIDPRTRRGVAVVRYASTREEPAIAEVAATVADAWQGRGLGTALLSMLVARAREEGKTELRANVLAANGRSIAMLRHAGFTIRSGSGALQEYGRPLPPALR